MILKEFKNGITIKLSEAQREYYDNLVKTLSEAVENIPEAREEFINNFIANESLYLDEIDTLNFLRNSIEQRNGTTQTFKQILKILLDHHTKNLKPDQLDESKIKDEHNTSNHRASLVDLDDKSYRQKIKMIFENTDDYLRNQANIVLRLRIPFLYESEMQKIIQEQEKQHQEELKAQAQIQQDNEAKAISQQGEGSPHQSNKEMEKSVEQQLEVSPLQEEQEQEEEKCKYDEFVEIFDGEGYKRELIRNLNTSQRRPLSDDHASGLNLWTNEEKHILYFDERTIFYLETVLHKIIKDILGNKVESIQLAQFQQMFDEIQENVLENFLGSIYDEERQEKMPIFDVDFGFNIPNE